MLIADIYHVPIWASLAVIAVTIAVSIVASLRRPPPAGEPVGHGVPLMLPTTRDGEGPSGEGGIRESMRER